MNVSKRLVVATSWQRSHTSVPPDCRVSGNLDRFTFAQRRQTLLTLKAEVLLYKVDRMPRVEFAFSLPLSGAVSLTDESAYHSDEKFTVLT
jgi:hypothetical protein